MPPEFDFLMAYKGLGTLKWAPALVNISSLIFVAASFARLRRKPRWGCSVESEWSSQAAHMKSNCGQ